MKQNIWIVIVSYIPLDTEELEHHVLGVYDSKELANRQAQEWLEDVQSRHIYLNCSYYIESKVLDK